MFLSYEISLFLFAIFFGFSARVIPLRSDVRVFCFVGSALNNTEFLPTRQTEPTNQELETKVFMAAMKVSSSKHLDL
jgi:predicted permease